MSYLIVPQRASSRAATVWVGSIDESTPAQLFAGGVPSSPISWAQLQGGPHRLAYARVQLTGLSPRTRHELELRVGNRVMAVGSTTTLPDALPTGTDQPVTVLLGSCFHAGNDQEGAVGRAFLATPQVDFKILCGDQVYLDAPWSHFLVHTHNRVELEQRFFETYQYTWEQAGAGSGFRYLLQDGANFFSCDDHEFWNNAPTAGAYARDTWFKGGRDTWWAVASNLYRAFQDDQTVEQFQIGPLSFFLADTRLNRDTGRNRLLTDADMGALLGWIRGLQGPGVLVVGQPIFSPRGGVLARFEDWNLTDFAQYEQLARALIASRHSIALLTGDVHFGRVAFCQLPIPGALNGLTSKLIEVISSPLSLVDSKVGGNWTPAPDQFPAFAISGMARVPLSTVEAFQMKQNHFLTLEFTGVGAGATMKVRSWPIARNGAEPPGQTVFQDTLY
jgi:hypothetical protein